jgi:hypothetical protein
MTTNETGEFSVDAAENSDESKIKIMIIEFEQFVGSVGCSRKF